MESVNNRHRKIANTQQPTEGGVVIDELLLGGRTVRKMKEKNSSRVYSGCEKATTHGNTSTRNHRAQGYGVDAQMVMVQE
jgi:hypothetical protein